jgi:hypothetical protein
MMAGPGHILQPVCFFKQCAIKKQPHPGWDAAVREPEAFLGERSGRGRFTLPLRCKQQVRRRKILYLLRQKR